MDIITHLIPPRIANAVGWTLLHSLWQIGIMALLFAVFRITTRRFSARSRYLIATGCMLIILLLATITFLSLYYTDIQSPLNSNSDLPPVPSVINLQPADMQVTAQTGREVWYTPIISYLDRYMPLAVFVWLLISMLLSLKLLIGVASNQRLIRSQTFPVPDFWQKKMTKLCQQLFIKKIVRFMESNLVKVPLVIGYFKPVILIPAGMLTGLPANQIESIIIHELGHIFRNDYMVNFFQCIMEIIFFYHPAIWWISSVIRTEREHCCDDYVLANTQNTLTYQHALVNMYAQVLDKHRLAVAVSGHKNKLLDRIKKISGETVKPSLIENLLSFFLLAIGILTIAFACNKLIDKDSDNAIEISIEQSDLLIDGERIIDINTIDEDKMLITPLADRLEKRRQELKQLTEENINEATLRCAETTPYSLLFPLLYTCTKSDLSYFKLYLDEKWVPIQLPPPKESNRKIEAYSLDRNQPADTSGNTQAGKRLALKLIITKQGFILTGNDLDFLNNNARIGLHAAGMYDYQGLVDKLTEIKEKVSDDPLYVDKNSIIITAAKDIEYKVIFNVIDQIRVYTDREGTTKPLFAAINFGMVL
jgi:beta-lactamase regulating signal transducer with metallopeptidase domain